MRYKSFFLALAILFVAWQAVYMILPLPHGDAYQAGEAFTLAAFLVPTGTALVFAPRRDSLAFLNYGQLLAAGACLAIEGAISIIFVALGIPAWLFAALSIVVLAAAVLMILVLDFGRRHAREVERENHSGSEGGVNHADA